MVLVYAHDQGEADALMRATRCREARATSSLQEFAAACSTYDCWLVRIDDLTRTAFQSIRLLHQAHPGRSIILVTDALWSNVRCLARIRLHEILLHPPPESAIASAVMTARRNEAFSMLEDVLRSSVSNPDALSALMVAVQASPPIKSVNQWARLCDCSTTTLSRWVRQAELRPGSPQAILQVIMLARAAIELEKGAKIRSLAASFGVAPFTLHRLSHRLLGRPLSQLRRARNGAETILHNCLFDGQPV